MLPRAVRPGGTAESALAQCHLSTLRAGIQQRALGKDDTAVYGLDAKGFPGLRGDVNLPNLITLARILSVPVVVWAIAAHQMLLAFVLFLAAGLSDAVDGYLAKRFDMKSELGAYLDPLADKVLIVSIYVALGISEAVPRWIVILVVSRDLMIVGAIILSWLVGKPIKVRPLWVSKLNTVAQIFFAGLVLASLGIGFDAGWLLPAAMVLVAALTLLSVAAYVREWVRHMGADGV
jgi:cardiolipin synthase